LISHRMITQQTITKRAIGARITKLEDCFQFPDASQLPSSPPCSSVVVCGRWLTPWCRLLMLMSLTALLLSAGNARAQSATLPTTKPIAIKPTPEQAAIIQKVRHEPTDQPVEKIETHLTNRDGTPNEYFGKVELHFQQKHAANLQRAKVGPIDLLFLGDSITDFFATTGREVWKRYAPMNVADFGVAGDRTENVIWRIDNGELDGTSPSVLVLMIGTNNMGGWPDDQILAGDTKIVQLIHEKLPNTKVLLLGIFPRGVDPANDDVKRLRGKIKEVNEGLAKLDDGNKTRFLDIGNKFLNSDWGTPARHDGRCVASHGEGLSGLG
jgi:lysophospholipase L1-like esterase